MELAGADFRRGHLAEGCGWFLSPGPWLCGSGGGVVLGDTQRDAAKASWVWAVMAKWSHGALCS